MHRPYAKHLHFSRNGIDLDLGDLAAEHISLPRPTRAIDRIDARRVGTERSGANRHHAQAFGNVHGFVHGDAMIGALGPDFSA